VGGREIDQLSDRGEGNCLENWQVKKRLDTQFCKGIKVRRDNARRQHKESQASGGGNWCEELE
jgi:hypothetical protein